MNKSIVTISMLVMLSACSSMDMQGNDPKDYYAANPIQNKVKRDMLEVHVGFSGPQAVLPRRDLAALNEKLAPVNRQAVDSVHVEAAPSVNAKQRGYLTKTMRNMGIATEPTFEPNPNLEVGEAIIQVSYASLQAPDCPDWKTSPVTTYSNTTQANFGCATTVNLGLMLEDPRDLERGASSGRLSPNADRASDAIVNYRTSLKDGPAKPVSSQGGTKEKK